MDLWLSDEVRYLLGVNQAFKAIHSTSVYIIQRNTSCHKSFSYGII